MVRRGHDGRLCHAWRPTGCTISATERVDYTAAHLLESAVPDGAGRALRGLAGRRLRWPATRASWPSRPRWWWPPATADRPSARTVLLKSVSAEGFVFFTNYDSRKGAEIAANAGGRAALRLVRAAAAGARRGHGRAGEPGRVGGLLPHPPRGSQLGAWASAQSSLGGLGWRS